MNIYYIHFYSFVYQSFLVDWRSVGLGLGLGKLAASIPQLRTPEALKVHVILCSGLGGPLPIESLS